jgi:hypothetical protein
MDEEVLNRAKRLDEYELDGEIEWDVDGLHKIEYPLSLPHYGETALPSREGKHKWAIYVCGGIRGGSPVKIGHTNDPYHRRRQIQTYWPEKVDMHFVFWVRKKRIALDIEDGCKEALKAYRLHGEVYGLHSREAALRIKEGLQAFGVIVDWLPDDVNSDNLGSFKYKGKSAWTRNLIR